MKNPEIAFTISIVALISLGLYTVTLQQKYTDLEDKENMNSKLKDQVEELNSSLIHANSKLSKYNSSDRYSGISQ